MAELRRPSSHATALEACLEEGRRALDGLAGCGRAIGQGRRNPTKQQDVSSRATPSRTIPSSSTSNSNQQQIACLSQCSVCMCYTSSGLGKRPA